jgi:hypothetical protein
MCFSHAKRHIILLETGVTPKKLIKRFIIIKLSK